jgi:hypothetical protein
MHCARVDTRLSKSSWRLTGSDFERWADPRNRAPAKVTTKQVKEIRTTLWLAHDWPIPSWHARVNPIRRASSDGQAYRPRRTGVGRRRRCLY